MQGKPEEGINDKDFIEILKKCAKVKAASFGCTVEETSQWHDANRLERLVNRLATYEAALRPLASLPIGPEIEDDHDLVIYKNAGRSITVGDILAARKALEDNT